MGGLSGLSGLDGALGIFGLSSIYVGSPETVTPTYGAEMVTNGDMELDANWTDSGSPSTNERSNEQAHGGTYSRKFVADGNYDGIRNATAFTTTTGEFYRALLYSRPVDRTSGRVVIRNGADSGYIFTNTFTGQTLNTWNELDGAYLESNGGSGAFIYAIDNSFGIGTGTWYIDDVSIKQITKSSALGDVRTAAASGTFVTAWPTAPTDGHRVGLIICLDDESDPQNFIMASLDGTNAYLDKWVGGVWTNLISAASAFVAGNQLQIVKDGNSVKLYHKGVQLGATQTISDAGVTNNLKMCWFTTNGSLKPTSMQWSRI